MSEKLGMSSRGRRSPSRRALLGGIGGVLTTSLTGCSSGGNGDGGGTEDGGISDQAVAEELVTARERMGEFATALERYVENGDVRFEDINASQQLNEADTALQNAADAIQTSEEEKQLEALVALLEVFDGVLRGLAIVVGDGLSYLEDALKAHERTANHYVEVELSDQGEVLNPGEMAAMMCGQMGELRDANEHLDEAMGAFDQSTTTLEEPGAAFDEIKASIEELPEIDTASVRAAIDGARAIANEMKRFVTGLKEEVNGEIASHEAGLMWTWTVSPEATGAYECENNSFEVTGSEDLEDTIRPRYVEAKELFQDANDILTSVNGEILNPGVTHTQKSFICLTDYAARSTNHRVKSIDALLADDQNAFAEHVHTAFDLEEEAVQECS